jgi:superfamily II DNA/RNA helicase
MTFDEFKLDETILEAISYMGIEKPTPIQELAIPKILTGNDLLACAQTGTGKTAAFLLPVIHKILESKEKVTDTLIIVPTRELAIQIDQQIQGMSYFTSVESIAVYGGGSGDEWEREKKALTEGADIIVTTPGKFRTHINMDHVKLDNLKHLILDEADRMLDIGFYDEIMNIISYLPKNRQTLLFSATMPPKVKKLANNILYKPQEVQTEISKPAEGILQAKYLVHDDQKLPLINELLTDKPDYDSILIFASTKKKVSQIVKALARTHDNVEGISSDLEQKEREEVMLRFKSRNTRILVATDVISRGIDIKDITLIINYDVPGDAEDYVHRVGRTARAKSTGVALTFVNKDDMYKFHRIEQLIEAEVANVPLPEGFEEGPEWQIKQRKQKDRKFKHKSKRNFKKKK